MKLRDRATIQQRAQVAPHAGAWIETSSHDDEYDAIAGRPPRGGVD